MTISLSNLNPATFRATFSTTSFTIDPELDMKIWDEGKPGNCFLVLDKSNLNNVGVQAL